MNLLETFNVHAGYGDIQILNGINIHVENNEIVTIIGPNGSGKSTLIKAIAGIIPVSHREISLNNKSIQQLPPEIIVRYGICYVPQTENIFSGLTVLENLEMGGFLLQNEIEEQIHRILTIFPDLKERLKEKSENLSGGQRQMLAIGRALMLKPSLLMLDEPSVGLSPIMLGSVFEKIQEINADNVAVLMVEQNAKKALSISSRGYVIVNGEIRLTASGNELLENKEIGDLYLGKQSNE